VCGISTLYTSDVIDTTTGQGIVAGYAGHLFDYTAMGLPNFDTEGCQACPGPSDPPPFPVSCEAGETWRQVDTVAKDPLDPTVSLDPPFGHNAALLGGARVTNGVAVFAGYFGVISRYDEGAPAEVEPVGAKWAQRLADGHFVDSTLGVVVGQKGVILATTDGGLTWTAADVSWVVPTAAQPTQSDVDDLNAVSFSGLGGRAVTVGTGGHVGLSADNGPTWTEPLDSGIPASVVLIDVSYVPSTPTVYASGTQGRVFRSDDDGQTWSTSTTSSSSPTGTCCASATRAASSSSATTASGAARVRARRSRSTR